MNDISYSILVSMSDDRILRQIGEFVKHHRMGQNKTQDMLAKEAGISRSTLSLLERGGTVTVATLLQVLRVLDQLHVLNAFTVAPQKSPLQLALEEKKKRWRVVPRKDKTDSEENVDW